MSHYLDVKNYGRIVKHDDYEIRGDYFVSRSNYIKLYTPKSIGLKFLYSVDGTSSTFLADIFDTDLSSRGTGAMSDRRGKVKTMYKQHGNIQYNFVHPYFIRDMFNYTNVSNEIKNKFAHPPEFEWFFVESIDIAVQSDDTKTFTYERGIDTVLQAAHYSLGAHARYEHTFKGLYSRKEGGDDISFTSSLGEDMKINRLGTFGSGTNETYRGHRVQAGTDAISMIATPTSENLFASRFLLEYFPPPSSNRGLFGSVFYDGIRYIHPTFYSADSLIGYGGSIKQNVSGGSINFNRVSGEYNSYRIGNTPYPRLDIETNKSLDLLFNHQVPSITDVLSSNEESEYQLANKNYEQGLEQQKTFGTLLNFSTSIGGFFLVGFWIKTFLSLGSLIMYEIDKKAREEDAKNNFDNGKIPHAVQGPSAPFTTRYESYYRNTLPYTYSVDFIDYKQTKTDNKHRQTKKPFVTIPINKLAKSSEELRSIISEHTSVSTSRVDISYRITIKPYMDTEYGKVVSEWSDILFHDKDVNGRYVSNWVEADKM